MKHPDLKKVLKKNIARTLLDSLAALAHPTTVFQVYNMAGQSLTDAATIETPPPQTFARTLTVDGAPIGYLVAAKSGDLIPGDQLDAAATLIEQHIAQVISNRNLAQETLERYREINLLYHVQEAIGAHLELDQIGELVLNESTRVIQATCGALLLLAPDRTAFEIQAVQGLVPAERYCSPDKTIAGWVVRARQPVIVNDVAADPRCGPADTRARSLLCAPLTVGDKSTGALVLYNKQGDIFTASDQKLLTALAWQAAIAIETAREIQIRENRLKAQIQELRIEIDEMRKQQQVASITATDYFAHLQQAAAAMRREFEQD